MVEFVYIYTCKFIGGKLLIIFTFPLLSIVHAIKIRSPNDYGHLASGITKRYSGFQGTQRYTQTSLDFREVLEIRKQLSILGTPGPHIFALGSGLLMCKMRSELGSNRVLSELTQTKECLDVTLDTRFHSQIWVKFNKIPNSNPSTRLRIRNLIFQIVKIANPTTNQMQIHDNTRMRNPTQFTSLMHTRTFV